MNNTGLFIEEVLGPAIGRTVAMIAQQHFEYRYITLLMFSALEALGLQTFLKFYPGSVIIKIGKFTPQHRASLHQIILFGDNASEISDTIDFLVKVKYDTNAKYIIACGVTNDEECDERIIFQTLARNYIINVIVLTTSYRVRQPIAYSYYMTLKDSCNNSIPHKLNVTKTFNFSATIDHLTNFHKCIFGLSTIEQPPFMYLHNGTKPPSGADGDLMRLLADMLNGTLYLGTPSDKGDCGHYTNNMWVGSLGDVYNGPYHASICSTPLTANKYANFQTSYEYYSMDIVWAAKLPSKRASWEKLLYPLNYQIRIALVFIFIAIVIINSMRNTRVWRKVIRACGFLPPKLNLLFYSWLLFLGLPMARLPIRKTFWLFIYAWVWFCFIIRSAYQAALINALKYPTYNENFNTIEDAIKKGYPYGGVVSLKDYYTDDPDVYNGWVDIDLDDLEDTLDAILDGTSDFVLASNTFFIQHQLKKYNGTKHLQIIPAKIVNSPTVVYFKKYSPLALPVNYVLRIAVEGGFVQQAYDRYLHKDDNMLHTYHEDAQSLTMEHFVGAFLILIIGWLLSIVYFIVEVVCGNLDHNDGQ